MVLEADSRTGLAKASCRPQDTTEIIELPISEVIDRLGNSSTLKLDGLSAQETEERVLYKDDRWFFQAREGEFGPFDDEDHANRALKRHSLSAQEEGRTGRPAQAMMG